MRRLFRDDWWTVSSRNANSPSMLRNLDQLLRVDSKASLQKVPALTRCASCPATNNVYGRQVLEIGHN